jgi:hypothetical protein
MTGLSTDTVITREVEWLSTTDDSLPVLVKTDMQDGSAPFDVIAGYWPRQPGNVRAVYVLKLNTQVIAETPGRVMPRHTMSLRVRYPIINGDLVVAQQGLDAALELLLLRVVGPLQTKTHGGRFLACAEPLVWGQPGVTVVLDDPARADGSLTASVTYVIDDLEQNL